MKQSDFFYFAPVILYFPVLLAIIITGQTLFLDLIVAAGLYASWFCGVLYAKLLRQENKPKSTGAELG